MLIRIESQQKNMRFRQGDNLKIGKIDGAVVEVTVRGAIIETADGRLELHLGKSLADATKLDSSST
jgi:hypothetical protein